jgi:hypothetical protein
MPEYQVNFFDRMVNKMEIHFEEPEAKIIVHNTDITENEYMFFIERGECQVKINDKIK